jgi:hypothetical protein
LADDFGANMVEWTHNHQLGLFACSQIKERETEIPFQMCPDEKVLTVTISHDLKIQKYVLNMFQIPTNLNKQAKTS